MLSPTLFLVEKDFCAEANCSDGCNVVNHKAVCSCPQGLKLSKDSITCVGKKHCFIFEATSFWRHVFDRSVCL